MTATTDFVPAPAGPETSNGHVKTATPQAPPKVAEPPKQEVKPAKPKASELRPIVAPWLKSPNEFTAKLLYTGHRAGHSAIWHTLHSPLHALRILRYSPRGLWMVTRTLYGWTLHTETRLMQREHALGNNSPEWLKLEKERKEAVHRRWIGVAVTAGVVLIALLLAWFLLPSWPIAFGFELTPAWQFGLTGFVAALGLGYHGRPRDGNPLIPRATEPSGDKALTGDVVLQALCSLKIPGMAPNDIEKIELLYGVKPTRVGYNIDLILPRGVTAEMVMKKRADLSSALQRSIGSVWPMRGDRHEGHLMLFISHKDVSKAEQKPWPLMKTGQVDVFKPVPMFTDQQGDWIEIVLANSRGVVGAASGMGKTHFLRELALVAGLDPRVEVYLFDLKCSGDLKCVKLFAHYYSDSDEEEDIKEHLQVLRKLHQERRRRAKVLKSLPPTKVPGGEVTSELASDPKLGLHPIKVIIDEADLWTTHPTYGDEFNALIEDLARRGRNVAISVYLASQEIGAKTIPPVITRQASIRVGFRVTSNHETDQVLGSGASSSGMRPHLFDPMDKGIAWVVAAGVRQIGRTVGALDKVKSEVVAKRARNLREAAGRLTGQAADEALEIEEREIEFLEDARQVLGDGKAIHLTDLAAGLADLRPNSWAFDADGVGKHLRNQTPPIVPTTVWVPGKGSAKGVKREQLYIDATSEIAGEEPRKPVDPLTQDQ